MWSELARCDYEAYDTKLVYPHITPSPASTYTYRLFCLEGDRHNQQLTWLSSLQTARCSWYVPLTYRLWMCTFYSSLGVFKQHLYVWRFVQCTCVGPNLRTQYITFRDIQYYWMPVWWKFDKMHTWNCCQKKIPSLGKLSWETFFFRYLD